MRYLRRVYSAPDEVRDLFAASLWEAGTLGVEEGAELVAWFTAPAAAVALPEGARLESEAWVEGEDWLAGWRATASPIAIGERLWVDPREPDAPAVAVPAGRLALRVPARTAFGTGGHASTSLALRLLERLPLAGAAVLDVGTGSGILALASLALGARRAIGFDLDVAAALLAGQHARLNGSRGAWFWAGEADSLADRARFDVVLANALPHELRPVEDAVARAVAPGGRLVVSGMLGTEADAALARWAALGLVAIDRLDDGEWSAATLARARGAP